MAVLFPQSAGLAPVPQRWMLVGSSGGAPSSCAAAHDTINRQQSSTPQEKVAFFTEPLRPDEFTILATWLCAIRLPIWVAWKTAKFLKAWDLFVNCIAHQAAILDPE